MSDHSTDKIDRSSISMETFNDLLTFSGDHATPTTHAPIIRDDDELLIYAKRSRNADSEWEVRSYRVIGIDAMFTADDPDRADIAAVLLEEFDGSDLTTDRGNMQRHPVRNGVPVAVAVDGKPAVAAWLYVRGRRRDEIAQLMDIGDRTASEYLSRFRRRGDGIPDELDVPDTGEIMAEVPPKFDPDNDRQQIVADGGEPADASTCHHTNCEQAATHTVNWTTERRREQLCDKHTERQQNWFPSEIRVRERGGSE